MEGRDNDQDPNKPVQNVQDPNQAKFGIPPPRRINTRSIQQAKLQTLPAGTPSKAVLTNKSHSAQWRVNEEEAAETAKAEIAAEKKKKEEDLALEKQREANEKEFEQKKQEAAEKLNFALKAAADAQAAVEALVDFEEVEIEMPDRASFADKAVREHYNAQVKARDSRLKAHKLKQERILAAAGKKSEDAREAARIVAEFENRKAEREHQKLLLKTQESQSTTKVEKERILVIDHNIAAVAKFDKKHAEKVPFEHWYEKAFIEFMLAGCKTDEDIIRYLKAYITSECWSFLDTITPQQQVNLDFLVAKLEGLYGDKTTPQVKEKRFKAKKQNYDMVDTFNLEKELLWTRWRPEMRHETSLDYRLEWLNSLHLELKLAILDKVDDYTLENLDTLKAIAAKRERVIIQAYGSYEEKEGIKPKNQDSKAEKKKKIPCRFYEQGNCTRKDCPYKHEKKR